MRFFRLMPMFALALSLLFLNSCTQEDITPQSTTNAEVDFRNRGGNDNNNNGPNNGNPVGDQTIVEIASSIPDFSILVDAVVKAGLVDALNNPSRKVTVFAPTNDAFVALLDAAGFASLDDVPVDVLTSILLTHVLPGTKFAADLSTDYFRTSDKVFGLNFTKIFIEVDGGVSINDNVNVVDTDIAASNGVIHVIDAVIQPSTLLSFVTSNDNFSILVQALTRPDLTIDFVGAISGEGPFTILAPTNDAFIALLGALGLDSLDDIPTETLEAVLSYHVVAGENYTARNFQREVTANTLLGETYSTKKNGSAGVIINANSNTANVIVADVQAVNGIIHAIDTVILP